MKQAELHPRLLSFLQELPIPETILASCFSKEALIHDQNLFLGFAAVFTPAFPGLSPAQEILLNAAVYLGAKGIYLLDPVLDEQVTGAKRVEQAYHGQLFLLESQRLLSQLFPHQDAFWPGYYELLTQHYQELTLSKNRQEPLTAEAYHHLLAHKYAMLYVPVKALFFLTGQNHLAAYTILLKSLPWFCQGYNLPNEVMGLAEDLHLRLNNYAYWRLQAYLQPMGIHAPDYRYEDLHKMLYASGLAVTLLDEAIEALAQAAQIAAPLGLADYQKFIGHRIENAKERREFIRPYAACMN